MVWKERPLGNLNVFNVLNNVMHTVYTVVTWNERIVGVNWRVFSSESNHFYKQNYLRNPGIYECISRYCNIPRFETNNHFSLTNFGLKVKHPVALEINQQIRNTCPFKTIFCSVAIHIANKSVR